MAMNRKQALLGSAGPVAPTLTASWTAEKTQALDEQLRGVAALMEKRELLLPELQWADRVLTQLRRQLPNHADVEKLSGLMAYRVGNNEQAETYLERARRLNPQDAEVDGHLSMVLRAQNRLETAEAYLDDALERLPRSPVLLRNLGNLYLDQGAFDAAADAYRRSLEIRPTNEDTWQSYSYALARRDRLADAVHALHEAAAQGLDHQRMLRNVGNWLLGYMRGREALPFFSQALQNDETQPENLMGVAMALIHAERPHDAEFFLDKVLEIDSEYVAARVQKGSLALERHRYDDALGHVEAALAKYPNAPGPLVEKARVKFFKDDIDTAEQLCQRALQADPKNPGAHGMLAQLARSKGKFDLAEKHANKVVELAPQKGAPLQNLYASKKDISEEDDVQSVLRRLEAQETTSKRDLTAYYYTLGELFHKLKSPERAIFFFKGANDLRRIGLKREGNVYRRDQTEAQIQAMEQIFTQQFFDETQHCGIESARPVFIVGMPRSGTTLTEQIIATHPLAYGAGELSVVPDLIRKTTQEAREAGENVGFPGWVPRVESETFQELAQRYLDRLAEMNGDALRVTDKMPHNFMNLGLIAAMFPNARIVHCMRDPVDNCLSCFQQNFAMPHAYSTNLSDMGHHYRQYRRLMAHWRKVIPNKIYEIQYEELVADQERVSRELIAFCGLDWDDRCLEFNKKPGAVKTASLYQVRQPIYTESVKKWKMYERYIEELLDELNEGLA
jgi:tetratricopeptide (TPR) repeat protein